MEQIKLRALFFCENLIIDKEGRISIIASFHNINVAKFPGGLPSFSLVGFFDVGETTESKESIMNVSITSADGEIIVSREFSIAVSPKQKESVMAVNFDNLMFREEGTYKALVKIDGVKVGEKQLNVKQK